VTFLFHFCLERCFLWTYYIAIDKKDSVFVVDYGTQHVHKFDSNDDFITMWGLLGCKDNQFLIPHYITIDPEGNIYINYSGNVHFREIIYVNISRIRIILLYDII
jgi:hypothetical protein